MGKIRSTLDIVMERTRSVHMTSEEKDRIRHKDHADSARSWVRKYLDSKMSISEIASQLQSAGSDRAELVKLLKGELLDGINLEGDNARIFEALEALCGISGQEVGRHVDRHRELLQGLIQDRADAMRAELARQGIKGAAVVPNPASSQSAKEAARQAGEALAADLGRLFTDT